LRFTGCTLELLRLLLKKCQLMCSFYGTTSHWYRPASINSLWFNLRFSVCYSCLSMWFPINQS